MAISAGLYGLTIEKMFIDTAGQSLEAETHKEALVTDVHVPDFNLDDFFDDIDNEVTGTGYSTGGVVPGSGTPATELTLSGGVMTYDFADTVYSTVTIADAMGGVYYFEVGTAAQDMLVLMQDFITAASATAADFTIQHNASGVFTLDYTP